MDVDKKKIVDIYRKTTYGVYDTLEKNTRRI